MPNPTKNRVSRNKFVFFIEIDKLSNNTIYLYNLEIKKSPQHLSILRNLTKTATTYSPTNQQYHRRDEA